MADFPPIKARILKMDPKVFPRERMLMRIEVDFDPSVPSERLGPMWKDYLIRLTPPEQPLGVRAERLEVPLHDLCRRAEALRHSIVERRIWQCGDWHQNADDGAPMFEDGTTACFSFRAWGDLLAAVWTEQLGRQYWYFDFYCCGRTPVQPADFEVRAARGVHHGG